MANARTGKDTYTLNFPCDEFKEIELTEALIKTSNSIPNAAYRGKSDVMLVFEDQQEVEQLLPQLDAIKKVDARGLIVTAQVRTVILFLDFLLLPLA